MAKSRGRHSAQRANNLAGGRRHRRRAVSSTATAVGVAGVAAAGAAVLGFTPTLAASPQLAAQVYYLRGTNIGNEPTDDQFDAFVSTVITGTGTPPPDTPYNKVPYNAGFWPVSHGGFSDLTWDASVQQGLTNLGSEALQSGDVIFGFSQGAVVASRYKGEHPDAGNTYVMVENPNRPNGGVLERFEGLRIPILDVTFNGPTPGNGDLTIDIARQYDGWADFPTYPLNLLATANALLGIVYLHGTTQTDVTAADISGIDTSQNSMYYQYDPDTNTKYYLIPTKLLPLLMPLNGIVPAPILEALDQPLRYLVELGYDRDDYGDPTHAQLFKPFSTADRVGVADVVPDETDHSVTESVSTTGVATPDTDAVPTDDAEATDPPRTDAPRHALPVRKATRKLEVRQHPSLFGSSPRHSVDSTVKAPTPDTPSADATVGGVDQVGATDSVDKTSTETHTGSDGPKTSHHANADRPSEKPE